MPYVSIYFYFPTNYDVMVFQAALYKINAKKRHFTTKFSHSQFYILLLFFFRQCDDRIDSNSFNQSEITATTTITTTSYDPHEQFALKFCDDGVHNRYAPTKQNQMCNHRSVLDVILKHADFYNDDLIAKSSSSSSSSSSVIDTIPKFFYKKRMTTRYVVILDETQDTMVRESWSFLRLAIRNWVVYDLPANTEVGVILANDTGTSKLFDISSLAVEKNRNLIASFIPFSPSESQRPACMNCAVKEAQAMLEKQTTDYGAANSIILIIAPGMDVKTDYLTLSKAARAEKIRIATINYPGVIHRKPLDALAKETSGLSYTLYESKQNSERTYLTTYFNLANILYNIMIEYFEGNRLTLPIEIHRKKLFDINDDHSNAMYSAKRSSRLITGTFLLDDTMGAPASFLLYTHNTEYPLINSASLSSPSGITYSKRSDERLSVKQMSIEAHINEAGTWTYTIDRFNGNPQPHFVQVMATVRPGSTSAVIVKAWIDHQQSRGPDAYGNSAFGSIIIYVEVKKGELPVNEALVEAIVTRPDMQCEVPSKCQQKFRILDTGSGDPDITKGDGIYTRYFSPMDTGTGTYQFDIQVTDNGNTAYSLPDNYNPDLNNMVDSKCCGSFVPHPSKQPLPSFQRIAPTLTVFVSEQQFHVDAFDGLGHIGDLKLETVDTSKIRLSWTAPDMGGINVARYEVKYALTVQDIVDNFETNAITWKNDSPLAFSIGDDTAFTMNISAEPNLIGKTIFVAVRPYARLASDSKPGPISNYARVHITPPPPPSVATTTSDLDSFYQTPYSTYSGSDVMKDASIYGAEIGWIMFFIIICVGATLLICFCAFCYFCILKRRSRANEKSSKNPVCSNDKFSKQSKLDKVNANISNGLIPSLTNNTGIHQIPSPSPPKQQYLPQQQIPYDQSAYTICPTEMPDPHTIGLPLYNSDEEISKQQRYSIIHDQENDILEKYKTDNHLIYRPCALAAVVSASKTSTLTRNGQILSPYESWSASHLLHEHERRHSSLDDMINPVGIMEHDTLHTTDNVSLINNSHHHGERLSISAGIGINSTPLGAPPVPPLPYTTNTSGYPINYQIYSSGYGNGNAQNSNMNTYSTVIRNQTPQQQQHQLPGNNNNPAFNSSLQGSMCSVHSGSDLKKKTRTITMV